MVKQSSSKKYAEYKMRTSHSGQINSSRPNHVQVAQSSGCCSSSKRPANAPSRPVRTQHSQPSPREGPTAHERSHLRLDQPDPFYHRQGRIRKNPNRTKKPLYGKNQVHPKTDLHQTNINNTQPHTNKTQPPSQQPPKAKTNCCCTIL